MNNGWGDYQSLKPVARTPWSWTDTMTLAWGLATIATIAACYFVYG